tara:strand:+ start:485 stop:847 length:363 start_codon:yes stop_codon:yes gene_type:complete
MAVNRIPPVKVKRNAQRGLEIRAKSVPSKKAMVGDNNRPSQGVRTARALISGKPLSPKLIQTMVAWFARHDKAEEEVANRRDKTSKAYQAFLAWGGSEGRAWAKMTLRRLRQEEERKKSQ